mmetsp:Transcript_29689/g.22045  ORF Transcript_29689/g.22045 Transcript_29689/m.22045 type:complete len:104 (+) Transcript_29689:1061-1372(+)
MHVEVAFLYNDLALTYQGLDLFEEAINFIDKTLNIYSNINMQESQEFMSALMLKADMHRELGEVEEAIRLQEDAIKLHRKLGEEEDTIDYAQMLKTLASDYLA